LSTASDITISARAGEAMRHWSIEDCLDPSSARELILTACASEVARGSAAMSFQFGSVRSARRVPTIATGISTVNPSIDALAATSLVMYAVTRELTTLMPASSHGLWTRVTEARPPDLGEGAVVVSQS